MRLPIFLMLFGAALLGTGSALRIAATSSRGPAVRFATVLSAATTVLWMLVTISAFEIVSVSNGTEISHSYPSLGVLGVLGVGVSVVILFKGGIELLE